MAGHNPRERRLLRDINEKNRLTEEFRRISARLRGWQKRLDRKKGKRWQAQYRLAIRRAQEKLAKMRPQLLEMVGDLKSRIEEEQKISQDEIRQFEQQYRKEVEELKEAQQALSEANAELEKAKAGSGEDERAGALLAELRRKRRDAATEMRREGRDLKKAEQEIASEERDKITLAYELRRIVGEIESLRG
jgi:predicted phage tail protein